MSEVLQGTLVLGSRIESAFSTPSFRFFPFPDLLELLESRGIFEAKLQLGEDGKPVEIVIFGIEYEGSLKDVYIAIENLPHYGEP